MRCCAQLPLPIAAIQPGLEPSLYRREIQRRLWPDAAPQYFVVRLLTSGNRCLVTEFRRTSTTAAGRGIAKQPFGDEQARDPDLCSSSCRPRHRAQPDVRERIKHTFSGHVERHLRSSLANPALIRLFPV
jgi:hypothetical protein